MFAVELERFRKTVQDEVQIELADDAEIELSFAAHGVSLVRSVQNHDTAEMARIIWVETSLGSRVKVEQLDGDNERREKGNLRRCGAKFTGRV